MNLYENAATQAIATFFHREPLWKKEILFNFLLQPFGLKLENIKDVVTQNSLQGTIPDFTIKTSSGDIHFEVKINDAILTTSERKEGTRHAFLVRKDYAHLSDIPPGIKILYWEDLFRCIDKQGATKEFARLALVREYMHDGDHTLLLTPHEVAMFYSADTIAAVYTMSEKLIKICENFLNTLDSNAYESGRNQKNQWGIGYYFYGIRGGKREFFVGINPMIPKEYSFSVALKLAGSYKDKLENCYTDDEWAYFPLDREILARNTSEEDQQKQFNEEAKRVLDGIESTLSQQKP